MAVYALPLGQVRYRQLRLQCDAAFRQSTL